MVNKEKRYKARLKAQGVIIGAGVTQGVIAVTNLVTGAAQQDFFNFLLFGLVALALAIFFVLFKHPVWGIAGTVVYAAARLLTLAVWLGALWSLNITGSEYMQLVTPKSLLIGLGLGLVLAVGLLAYFIYADVQAFKLRKLERETEETE